MQSVDDCPSCAGRSWRRLGEARFDAAESETMSDYVRKRYRVLFEVWRPGEPDCTVTFLACEICGLVVYSPRPSERDLDEKYRFLVGLDSGSSQDRTDASAEVWRARDLHRQLRPFLRASTGARILDFGGGDGRLLARIRNDDNECAIVDWCDEPVEGVRWLGHTLDEIHPSKKFDIIVASHVMEHVARPREILERLGRLLTHRGVVYVEVPLEIWGGPPRIAEPVTHVNYFVPGSLVGLLRNSGYSVERCRLGVMRQLGGWAKVIRAVARLGGQSISMRDQRTGNPAHEIDRFLRPTRMMRIHQRLANPETWLAAIRYHARRL